MTAIEEATATSLDASDDSAFAAAALLASDAMDLALAPPVLIPAPVVKAAKADVISSAPSAPAKAPTSHTEALTATEARERLSAFFALPTDKKATGAARKRALIEAATDEAVRAALNKIGLANPSLNLTEALESHADTMVQTVLASAEHSDLLKQAEALLASHIGLAQRVQRMLGTEHGADTLAAKLSAGNYVQGAVQAISDLDVLASSIRSMDEALNAGPTKSTGLPGLPKKGAAKLPPVEHLVRSVASATLSLITLQNMLAASADALAAATDKTARAEALLAKAEATVADRDAQHAALIEDTYRPAGGNRRFRLTSMSVTGKLLFLAPRKGAAKGPNGWQTNSLTWSPNAENALKFRTAEDATRFLQALIMAVGNALVIPTAELRAASFAGVPLASVTVGQTVVALR